MLNKYTVVSALCLLLLPLASSSTCLEWSDPKSMFMVEAQHSTGYTSSKIKYMVESLNATLNDTASIFIPASFMKCLASVNTTNELKLLNDLMLSYTCQTTIQNANIPGRVLIKAAQDNLMGNITNSDFTNSVCPFFMTSAYPCAVDNILPWFTSLLNSRSGGCCDDLTTQIKGQLGDSIEATLTKLLQYIGNILCSTQSPGFDGATTQTCGYSLISSFLAAGKGDWTNKFKAIMQIPNSQGCKAVEGQSFVLTDNKTTATLFKSNRLPSGCTAPISNCLSWMSNLPLITAMNMSSLLSNDNCYRINISRWDLPFGAVLNGDMCLHIANGYSSTCQYSSPAKAVFLAQSNSATSAFYLSFTIAISFYSLLNII